MFTTQDEGDRGYADGLRCRQLADSERSLLATHVPPMADGRALDEDELAHLQADRSTAACHDTEDLASVVRPGPRRNEATPQAGHPGHPHTAHTGRHPERRGRRDRGVTAAPLRPGGVGTQGDGGGHHHPKQPACSLLGSCRVR
ncbi:hypothetical protein ACF08M_12570 [Streptomyces sp. NPDC015032]|uniref:hypothetical protein n=1 Tax=Streptomyces sp. NPDC015032 TaxID=3364937 RepID=UPI0036F8781B